MSAGRAFIRTRKTRFADCDPAGIAFYPRLIEQVNNTVEEWFDQCLGLSFCDLHQVRHEGAPTRSLSVDFQSPTRLGDLLTWRLLVMKTGRSSINLVIEAIGPSDTLVLQAKVTLIWCRFQDDTVTSIPIPDQYKRKMTGFMGLHPTISPSSER